MAAATPSLSSNIPDLTKDQKEYLQRIWKSNQRVLIDVKPTSQEESKSKRAPIIPGHTHRFILRLYQFLLAFLTNAQQGTTTTTTNDSEAAVFLKDTAQSCLREFADIALNADKEIRLLRGRRVIAMHHEDFLAELNHYELHGQPATQEFIRRDSFGAFLYHMPVDALAAIGCAMRLAVLTLWKEQQQQQQQQSPFHHEMQQFLDNSQLIVRFVHVQPQVQMMDIKTGLVGKFLTVKGHVVKARPKQLRVATADFGCQKCGGVVTHAFEAGRYSVPTKCYTDNCRSRSFSLIRPTARYVNVQQLRLQEAQEESTVHAGRTPRQLEVELTHDLVDICRPGDIVLVAACVAAINTAVAAGKAGKRALETSTYKLYLQGHSVTTMSESNRRLRSSQVVYTQQQLQSITKLCHADHYYFGLQERRAFPFDLLVRSLCPSIIGHNAVKAGLLLCLLGGTPPSSQTSEKEHSIRCNSHILIVGDPGMGKSQMLLAASQLAARSVYVGGNTSSTTGLTVTLTKEEGGESGIEAGALVLADQGICCIDEFDKMAKNHQDGLLEAMEQQQVSIAKAGVVASLPARCSVVAAANPKHGSYSMSKTVAENLNMAKPILSRFDLVFILRDRADKEQDQLVSSNIMNLYRNNKDSQRQMEAMSSVGANESAAGAVQGKTTEQRLSLSDRLRWVHDFQKQPLPADLVRDYIAYAREYCKPKLTAEAATVLKDYFMELRYPADGRRKRDTVPITTRQLEALIRLCQARAKACLRDFVLKEDALDVVELMSMSVEQVHSDERGLVDVGRGGAGGKSNRKMKKAFVHELQRIVGVGAECSMDDLRRIADKVNCGLSEFQTLVEDLRSNGILMKKSSGRYQVLS